jgi:hypothetical protein
LATNHTSRRLVVGNEQNTLKKHFRNVYQRPYHS